MDDYVFRARAIEEQRKRSGQWGGSVRAHIEYQDRPVDWIVDYLEIPRSTIVWSENPEYQNCHCRECCKKGNEGKPHIWDGTVDPLPVALNEIASGGRVAVSAATGTSKTFTLGACGALYFLASHPDSIVLSIATREDQLLLNMWKEIGKLMPRFKKHFPEANLMSGKLVMRPGRDDKEVWAATAMTAKVGAGEEVAQNLAGSHAPCMLWVLEELAGVDKPVLNTVLNTAVGGFNPILGMGNPDHVFDTLGTFSRKARVVQVRISALDYPNVVCGRDLIPGAATQQSIDDRLSDAGGNYNDPIYLTRVRGIAPEQSRRALIQRAWLDAAAARMADENLRLGPLALGVDPADSPTGDQTAISRWQGAVCTEVDVFHAEDASEVGRIVYREMMDPENPVDPRRVGVDPVGIGASTVNELKRLGVKVRLIGGGSKPMPTFDVESHWDETSQDVDGRTRPAGPTIVEAERYKNFRAQVFWRLREDLRLGRIAIPNDPLLFEELLVLEYEEKEDKIFLPKKEEAKNKLGRSPNRADSLAYGNWVRARRPVLESKPRLDELAAANPHIDYGLERLSHAHNKAMYAKKRQMKRVVRRMTKRR